jgi:hypothetical protein
LSLSLDLSINNNSGILLPTYRVYTQDYYKEIDYRLDITDFNGSGHYTLPWITSPRLSEGLDIFKGTYSLRNNFADKIHGTPSTVFWRSSVLSTLCLASDNLEYPKFLETVSSSTLSSAPDGVCTSFTGKETRKKKCLRTVCSEATYFGTLLNLSKRKTDKGKSEYFNSGRNLFSVQTTFLHEKPKEFFEKRT